MPNSLTLPTLPPLWRASPTLMGSRPRSWQIAREHFVFVNEDSREAVGKLDNKISVQEDPTMVMGEI